MTQQVALDSENLRKLRISLCFYSEIDSDQIIFSEYRHCLGPLFVDPFDQTFQQIPYQMKFVIDLAEEFLLR